MEAPQCLGLELRVPTCRAPVEYFVDLIGHGTGAVVAFVIGACGNGHSVGKMVMLRNISISDGHVMLEDNDGEFPELTYNGEWRAR